MFRHSLSHLFNIFCGVAPKRSVAKVCSVSVASGETVQITWGRRGGIPS